MEAYSHDPLDPLELKLFGQSDFDLYTSYPPDLSELASEISSDLSSPELVVQFDQPKIELGSSPQGNQQTPPDPVLPSYSNRYIPQEPQPNALSKKRRLTGDTKVKMEGPTFSYHPYYHPKMPRYCLFNHNRQDISSDLDVDVRADKNVQYDEDEEDFIHYKQNHFQITTELLATERGNGTYFVETQRGILQPVEALYTDVYAIKSRKVLNYDEEQRVPLYQAGKTRTKGDNHPAEPAVLKDGVAIHSRLRFGASTPHTKAKDNPNQEYFRLVVALRALSLGALYHIQSRISDPLIVRGSNPGRYVNSKAKTTPKVEFPPSTGWVQRGVDILVKGKVGINTDTPQEALTVHGNALVTGNILKPSDQRIKENIVSVNTAKQLENIKNLKIYDYELKQWKDQSVSEHPAHKERGVLAQELQAVLPEAVEKLSEVQLQDGKVVHNLLVVNERVLLFENIGATQELSKIIEEESGVIGEIDSRVEKLEVGETVRDQTQTRLEQVIDFITSEELSSDTDDGGFCYCSIFGMGPAWTLFIVGFFFWLFWFFGSFYIFYFHNKTRRTGGVANLIALVAVTVYVALVSIFLPHEVIPVSLLASFIAGIVVLTLLAWHQSKKNVKRKAARKQLRKSLRKKPPKEFRLQPKIYSYSSVPSERVPLREDEVPSNSKQDDN